MGCIITGSNRMENALGFDMRRFQESCQPRKWLIINDVQIARYHHPRSQSKRPINDFRALSLFDHFMPENKKALAERQGL